jgi:hypothetical protein
MTQWCSIRPSLQPIDCGIDICHTNCQNPKLSFQLILGATGWFHPNQQHLRIGKNFTYKLAKPKAITAYQQKIGRQMLLAALEIMVDPRKGADFTFTTTKLQAGESTPCYLKPYTFKKLTQRLYPRPITDAIRLLRIPVEDLPPAWGALAIPHLI